jgi:hypothetical protein
MTALSGRNVGGIGGCESNRVDGAGGGGVGQQIVGEEVSGTCATQAGSTYHFFVLEMPAFNRASAMTPSIYLRHARLPCLSLGLLIDRASYCAVILPHFLPSKPAAIIY